MGESENKNQEISGGEMNIDKGQYWDKAVNFFSGCTPISPGCENCWALAYKKRFNKGIPYTNIINQIPGSYSQLDKGKESKVIALNWLGDLYHKDIGRAQRGLIWDGISTSKHTFLALTKRPETAVADGLRIPDNVWFGISIENQETCDSRLGAIRYFRNIWLSIEPLIAPVILPIDLLRGWEVIAVADKNGDPEPEQQQTSKIIQVIVGGENGAKARPTNPDWVRSIRDQCKEAEIPFFFKGWGEWVPSKYESYSSFPVEKAGELVQFETVASTDRKSIGEISYSPIPKDYTGGCIKSFPLKRKKRNGFSRLLDGKYYDELAWKKEAV